MLKRIFSLTIWATGAIPADEWKYRNLKRIMFPMIDFIFFLAGLSAAYYGVPAISEFFPREVVDTYSTLLSMAALASLFGVIFPRNWPWEIVGRSIVFGLMVGYFVSLFLLTAAGEGNRGFVLTIAGVAITVICWRLTLLGSEWQDRKVEERRQHDK